MISIFIFNNLHIPQAAADDDEDGVVVLNFFESIVDHREGGAAGGFDLNHMVVEKLVGGIHGFVMVINDQANHQMIILK